MISRIKAFIDGRISFKFLAITAATTTIIFGLLLFWFSSRQEEHIMEQVRKQAIILYKQLVLTRQWVADHNAILIPKTEEVRSSPFLEQPDVQGSDGVTYTKITASVLTKLLSDRAARGDLYSFRLTNTDRLNPSNVPDPLEAEAIATFKSSSQEGIFRIEHLGDKTVLRYVAPVFVNETCLQCHMAQGFKPGHVGGCLSVFVPMDEAYSAIKRSRMILLGGGMAFACSFVALLFISTKSLFFKRIDDIRTAMSRLTSDKNTQGHTSQGDELKEIAGFCYVLDEKLKGHHQELERKIAEATRDLSETNQNLEEANKELANLDRARAEFFSDISHELRTPLTSIKGATDILARKSSFGYPEYLDIIKRNTDHLIKIVADFLDYSRIQAGQLELDITEASLREVAEDAIISHKALAQKRSVNLELDAPEDRILKFDPKSIYQVMGNLLSNAIKFSPDEGTVAVRIRYLDHCAEVSVQDQGPGIDAKYHENIFKKFYQVTEQNTKIHRGSSGIGLAICKGLVEAHGGRIWVESKLEAGSTFTFSIPITDSIADNRASTE
jgi:signal transduction histidine kinase